MVPPTPFYDDGFLAASFSWALCLKQIGFLFFILVSFHFFYNMFVEKDREIKLSNWTINKQSEKIYHLENQIDELDEDTKAIIRERDAITEQRRVKQATEQVQRKLQKEKEREERKAEREKLVNETLATRGINSVKSSKCKNCGGNYGTGTACQYCGQA